MKCLAQDPDARYASALELSADLESWLAGEPISVKAPSIFSRAQRWFRKNSRLVYVGFSVLTGLVVTIPFVTALLLSEDAWHRDVYSRFPANETPWLYSFWTIPDWIFGFSVIAIVFVLYPSIGLLNALVVRTKSVWHAIGAGITTSLILFALFFVLLGWIPIASDFAQQSDDEIRTLARAVWTPQGTSKAEAVAEANRIFEGLSGIPETERADLVAQRISSDQFATGPITLVKIGIVTFMLAIPIVVGTGLAHALLRRGNRFWVCFIRYAVAWWSVTFIAIISFMFVAGGAHINGKPLRDFSGMLATIILLLGTTAFLAVRRWRRAPSNKPSATTSNEVTPKFEAS